MQDVGQKGRMQEFHAKNPEKSKLSTYRAIRQGPYSKYSEYDTYGKYDSCKEHSMYGKYGMYSEYNTYGEYNSCKEYSTYGKYRKYNSCKELQSCSTYRKYGKTYDKVATADDQAPNPKRGGKGGTERCRKDTLSWFSPQGFFTGFIKAL